MGITDFAAKSLGDIVFVDLPERGLEIEQGQVMGAVESVKSASDILAPVSGTVIDTNDTLADTPGLLNKDPTGEAWLAKLEGVKVDDMDSLLSLEEYQKLTEEE
jgi:glycine cleavage system H protein